MANDLQARDQAGTEVEGRDWVQGQVDKIRPHLRELGVDDARFRRIVLAELSRDAQTPGQGLMKALQHTPAKFYGAVLLSAQLDLEPGPPTGLSWIIPYADHGTPSCRWQLGYKGVIDLAWRVGIDITAGTVYPDDEFEVRGGTDPGITHTPTLNPTGEPIAWYAVARLPDGRMKHRVLNKAQIEERRKAGKTKLQAGRPWYDWYDSMARKTAILSLRGELPLSGQLKQGLQADNQPVDLPSSIRLDGPSLAGSRPGALGAGDGQPEGETVTVDGRTVDRATGELVEQQGQDDQARPASPADSAGADPHGEGGSAPATEPREVDDEHGPVTPADVGGEPSRGAGSPATDRQMMAIAHVQGQRHLDDHDICQLVLDRFGIDTSTVEDAIAALDQDQAGELLAELQPGQTAEPPTDQEPPDA